MSIYDKLENRLYYLTGFAGSGKTTIAVYEFYNLYKDDKKVALITDMSKEVKNIWCNTLELDTVIPWSNILPFNTVDLRQGCYKKYDVLIVDRDMKLNEDELGILVESAKELEIPIIVTLSANRKFRDKFGQKVILGDSEGNTIREYDFISYIKEKMENINKYKLDDYIKEGYEVSYRLNYEKRLQLFIPAEEVNKLISDYIEKNTEYVAVSGGPEFNEYNKLIGFNINVKEEK